MRVDIFPHVLFSTPLPPTHSTQHLVPMCLHAPQQRHEYVCAYVPETHCVVLGYREQQVRDGGVELDLVDGVAVPCAHNSGIITGTSTADCRTVPQQRPARTPPRALSILT